MSAFYTKYRIEHADIYNLKCKIDIQEYLASEPTPIDLKATGEPLKIEFNSDSDDWNEPIRPSKAVFNVYSMTDFSLMDLYNDEDMHFKVLIYFGANLYWQGYIVTGEYQEPYDQVPYPVQITAVDGLNYLKSLNYAVSSSVTLGVETVVYYTGRTYESAIIIDILAKIQIPLTAGDPIFTEYINIYEESMADTVDDSPFDQLVIDANVFKDMSCYDVLSEILKKYNASIRQVGGVMVIYRPKELTGVIVYGRIFTDASTKTSTSYIPDQFIKRVGISSYIRDVPGSIIMIKRPAKKITLSQDYGYKESWINNWEFKGNTYDSATYRFNGWNYTGAGILPVIHTLKGEFDGVVVPALTTGPGASSILYQSFGDFAVVTTDLFIIEFDYFFSSLVDAQNITLNIKIKADGASKYLYPSDDLEAKWNAADDFLDYTIAVGAKETTDWISFKRTITGIPTAGSYTISIYAGTASVSPAFIGIKNIKFYNTSDAIITKKRKIQGPIPHNITRWVLGLSKYIRNYIDNIEIVQKIYTIYNPVNGIDVDSNYILGDVTDSNIDNVIEQFAGSLATYISGTMAFSTDWNTRGGSESKPILEIIGGEIANQMSKPRQLIQLNFTELKPVPLTLFDHLINGTYSTLNSHNLDIINAIKLANNAGYCSFYNGALSEYKNAIAGDIITIKGNLHIIAGNAPKLQIYENGTPTYDEYLAEGVNTINYTITETAAFDDHFAVSIRSNIAAAVGNFTFTNVSVTSDVTDALNLASLTSKVNILGNFQDILNSIYGKGSNLITDPSGNGFDYDTLTTSGISITRAINLAGDASLASNVLSVISGEVCHLIVNLNLVSGQVPTVGIWDNTSAFISNTVALVAGNNIVELTVTSTDATASLIFSNSAAANWITGDIVLCRKPRKFIINRGELDFRNRMWNCDLMEIID